MTHPGTLALSLLTVGVLTSAAMAQSPPPGTGCAPADPIPLNEALAELKSTVYPKSRTAQDRPDVLRERRLVRAFEGRSPAQEQTALPKLIALLDDKTEVWAGVHRGGYEVLDVRHRALDVLERLTLQSFGAFARTRGRRFAPGVRQRRAAAERKTVQAWKAWWAKNRQTNVAALRAARLTTLIDDLADAAKAPAAARTLTLHASALTLTAASRIALRKAAAANTHAKIAAAALGLNDVTHVLGRPDRCEPVVQTAIDVATSREVPAPLRQELVLRLLETNHSGRPFLWAALKSISDRLPARFPPGARLTPSANTFVDVTTFAARVLGIPKFDPRVYAQDGRRAALKKLKRRF